MRRIISTLLLLLLAVAIAPPAGGQANTPSGAWGFVNTRYDTRSSVSIYTGYGWHNVFAMGGMVHNPRTGNAELLGGVGVVVRTWPRADHWLAFATARVGNDSYAQVYWLPTVRRGAVTVRANAKWTIPYEGSAPSKVSVSPLSVTHSLNRHLAAGVAVDIAAAEHKRGSAGVGPELRLRLPGAVLVADALYDVTEHGSRQRVFLSLVF